MVASNVLVLGGNLWLAIWVGAYDKEGAVDIAFYLGIYMAVSLGETVLGAVTFLLFESGAWYAARTLHRNLIRSLLGVSLSWFNKIPVGRVINRLSRDVNSVDTSVSRMLQAFLDSALMLLFRIGALGVILPIFMVPAAATCFVGMIVGEMYTRVGVTLKKLVSSTQSPMFTQFSDTLAGLAVIRARSDMPDVFGKRLADRLRTWCRSAEANYNCNRWVGVRVDFITALVSLAAGMIAVSKTGTIAPGLVGFSLLNSSGLNQTILQLVRVMNELEIELQSVGLLLSSTLDLLVANHVAVRPRQRIYNA